MKWWCTFGCEGDAIRHNYDVLQIMLMLGEGTSGSKEYLTHYSSI